MTLAGSSRAGITRPPTPKNVPIQAKTPGIIYLHQSVTGGGPPGRAITLGEELSAAKIVPEGADG